MQTTKSTQNLKELTDRFLVEEAKIREGGGEEGVARQRRHGRLTVRERIEKLVDDPTDFIELGLWAAWGMYQEWGELPAAGVIVGIGSVSGRQCLIIANDATVKAGAFFPQTIKKVLRAQRIAYECRLPIIYLVDSSGVFLPLQDEIFPDEDDFGRIFRNNAVISAAGIPQFGAIMGNCIAGGGYLPVLCDQLLMTEGSGLYLAGPALVKAAIGQNVDTEELGGAKMHAEISGTVDFLEKDDYACIARLRMLMDALPPDEPQAASIIPQSDPLNVYDIVSADCQKTYDMHLLLNCFIDKNSWNEYKSEYGKTLICGFAKIGGKPVGMIANQRAQTKTGYGEVEIGGVIYSDAADKAARFVMDCNQMRLPIVFIQDVFGFMVGKEAEQSGIIRSGAKLVNAISNSVVPKITVVVGNSFGAGHYALCGKAYDPNFILAWPNARYAVMGGAQAAETLFTIQKKAAERHGRHWNQQEADEAFRQIADRYDKQMDIRFGAARGWVDAVIVPHETREYLNKLIELTARAPIHNKDFHTGVIQV
jgi:acetyl-CoA carboxylase carboxyltransferase component